MDNFRLNLLERIGHNDLFYAAESSSEAALKEFERLALALIDFEQASLIEIEDRQTANIYGKDYYSSFKVRRLTADGERQLKRE